MARAIWKGQISFGLVNVPVQIFAAESRAELSFHMLDSRDRARVRYERVNEVTGEEVPWKQVVKGYEYQDGKYVLLNEEDFQRAAPETSHAIEIEQFVDRDAIDDIYFDKPYYLAPGKGGEKAYALLRTALERTGKAGIARVVIRTRAHLAAVFPRGDLLALDLLRYPQEVRNPAEMDLPGLDASPKLSKQEIDMAEQLVTTMSGEWDPSLYHDEYRESLMAYIQQKVEAGELEAAPEAEEEDVRERADVIDIMSLLRKSVEQQGGAKGGRKKGTKKAAGKPTKKTAGTKSRSRRQKAG